MATFPSKLDRGRIFCGWLALVPAAWGCAAANLTTSVAPVAYEEYLEIKLEMSREHPNYEALRGRVAPLVRAFPDDPEIRELERAINHPAAGG
jgi:hypothetical protein